MTSNEALANNEIYFIGLLSNVNSTILKFPLEHGIRIESMTLNEGAKLIAQLSGSDSWSAQRNYNIIFLPIRSGKLIVKPLTACKPSGSHLDIRLSIIVAF